MRKPTRLIDSTELENIENIENDNNMEVRSRATMVVASSTSDSSHHVKLYIIGGITTFSKYLMDVWEYDIESQEMTCLWKSHMCEEGDSFKILDRNGERLFPQPRCSHSCVYSGNDNCLYMFGGVRLM